MTIDINCDVRSTAGLLTSLQAELLPGRECTDRFANAPLPRLGSLGRVNPHDKITPVPGRECLKECPGFGVCLECCADVRWQLGNFRLWRIAVRGWSRREAGRRE